MAGETTGPGELRQLRRLRRAALLPAAGPATAASQLRGVRAADQEHRGSANSCAATCSTLFNAISRELRARVQRLENGPPVGYPVQFRVSGRISRPCARWPSKVADIMRANPHVANVNLDWDEPSKVVRLDDRPGARARARRQSRRIWPTSCKARCPACRSRSTANATSSSRCCCAGQRRRTRAHALAGRSRRADATGQERSAQRRSPPSNTASRTASSGGATASRRSPCKAISSATSRRPR